MSDLQKNQDTDRTQNLPQYISGNSSGIPLSHRGPILGILIILLVLIVSGLYLWGGSLSQNTVIEEIPIVNNEPETPRANADIQITETLSPSDSIEAIEADINSTNFDSLDTELSTIDTELDAALQVQ